MSNGMPYVKWHGRDWLGDPLLRMVGPEARGVWIDLLCVMMESEPYGHLAVKNRPMKDKETAALIGMSVDTYKGILYRLEEAGIPSRTDAGMLYSRRLVRDHARFITGQESGRKGGGNPRLRGKNQEARIQKPEAKGGLKVPYKGAEIPASLETVTGFAEIWTDFLDNRTAKKAKATPKAQALILATLSEHPERAVEGLKQAIIRNWTGFRWDWVEGTQPKDQPRYRGRTDEDDAEWNRAWAAIADAIWDARDRERTDKGAISRAIKVCRDKWRDVPKQGDRDVVTAAVDMAMNNERAKA